MKLTRLYTDRHFQQWPSWSLVYEWEDIIEEQLNLSLKDTAKAAIVTRSIDRVLASVSRRLKLSDNKLLRIADQLVLKPAALYFEMYPQDSFRFSASKNTVPFIIDFWKTQDLATFYKIYRNCKLVLISSKEVYDYLKEHKCPLNIQHVPLSLSDKYKVSPDSEKKIDILLAGRTSPVLGDYLKRYEKLHPGIEYFYSKIIDGEIYYFSNKNGIVGNYHKREDYLDLLRTAKVTFYSTPGIDGFEERTGGFNPVTPRLFELAASGCSIIARYPVNPDTDFFRLPLFYPSADSYELFEKQLTKALHSDADKVRKHNQTFLTDHYTSNRARMITDIVNNIA
ncbi:MAG TPA: glycosyltransferase [Mucilaginibacter sp.]|jgi:hypothetical protein